MGFVKHNQDIVRSKEYTSTQQEICKEQNRENAMLRAFDGNTLDYIDLNILSNSIFHLL